MPGPSPDAAYTNLRDLPHNHQYREFAESLWEEFAPEADANFRERARAHLHPQFWEMYLFVALRRRGLDPRRVGHEGPDFLIERGGARFWVEAVAPGPGVEADAVPQPPYGAAVASRVPEEKILLRFTTVLAGKAEQFRRARDRRQALAGDGYVLAINSRDVGHSWAGGGVLPYFVKAFLGIGHLAVPIDTTTGEAGEAFLTPRNSVVKESGKTVPTDGFLSGRFPAVSCALHSVVDCANLPRDFGADFQVAHNPTATVPAPRDLFSFCRGYVRDGDQIQRLDP